MLIPANSSFKMKDTALNTFKEYLEDAVIWIGSSPRAWAKTVITDEKIIASLPVDPPTRSQLRDYCADASHSDEACFLAVVAWGGMRRIHGRSAWAAMNKWLPLIRAMRSGKLTERKQLFSQFLSANVPGMGPAYFTKLMFFMCKSQNCYILDQWTARSTNLLVQSDTPLIKLTGGTWVNKSNTPDNYSAYCDFVEQLAADLERKPEQIEEKMFSGGKGNRWRKYIKAAHSGKA
ncbi:hypothetical protein [Undibacterium sp. Ji49W]|uniref:8-oxoguanine DNA glycosylase OGG fold protein n=1 Tax=Undibacterium sp. Ji49W TaxID=3413040 RepID=UPI003BF29DCD